ncbi:MAG: hypothetical protein QOJ56_3732 [Mycobacterium sp.]|jgi:hypothetical protein|nr:hypothetical protein [Mycobacterium sp.]
MTTDDNDGNSTGDDDNRADTVTHHPDQETVSGQVDDQGTMPEQIEKPRRRRWVCLSEAAHQHPAWMPIGAGVAGLVVGAGVTAALFAAYVPPTPALPAAGAALREAPPVGVDAAPPPRTWTGPPPLHGPYALDDPLPPPPPPGAPPPPGWGPPPPPGGPPPPPGWGPPPPPGPGAPPPPPGWGPPPPPGWGPPPPPGWGPPPPGPGAPPPPPD